MYRIINAMVPGAHDERLLGLWYIITGNPKHACRTRARDVLESLQRLQARRRRLLFDVIWVNRSTLGSIVLKSIAGDKHTISYNIHTHSHNL
jgi:hypothetical protein